MSHSPHPHASSSPSWIEAAAAANDALSNGHTYNKCANNNNNTDEMHPRETSALRKPSSLPEHIKSGNHRCECPPLASFDVSPANKHTSVLIVRHLSLGAHVLTI